MIWSLNMKMLLLSVFLALVTGVSAFRQLSSNSLDKGTGPLKFIPSGLRKQHMYCNGLGQPSYSIINTNKTGNFELRQYDESRWVTTHSEGIDYDKASRFNFMKLFNYIDGKNSKGEKVVMTCPVIVKITPGPGPACTSNFTMSFFVDPSAKEPPMPSTSDIYFTKIPAVRAYARTFGGYADYKDYRNEGLELMKAIGDPSLFNVDFYYTAGYDSPFKLLLRHNEVWFIAK
ncbi:heme-binding protein 2-like [Argopecten irradians]|uniref:heme-binding protein 2-like n=1 Tax=Argopecten irradians TaxID=31199 RepID=UPI0037134952